jgi:SAM-dependent methyltransferase
MADLLLPDALKALWSTTDTRRLTSDEAMREQERLIGEYAGVWSEALLLPGERRLTDSLLRELRELLPSMDQAEFSRRWSSGDDNVAEEWREQHVDPTDRNAVEAFYDQSVGYLFELMQWHTLDADNGPLAYVVALRFAERHDCHEYLDFGSGVGSGALLFARHGFDVTLADISSTMLQFARSRLARRGVSAAFIDLKEEQLPRERYGIVTAMDVWEHLVDPVETARDVAAALKPGGFLFGRFAAEPDARTPQHILFDFEPTFRQFERDGLACVWTDDWLWGHQAFQKR